MAANDLFHIVNLNSWIEPLSTAKEIDLEKRIVAKTTMWNHSTKNGYVKAKWRYATVRDRDDNYVIFKVTKTECPVARGLRAVKEEVYYVHKVETYADKDVAINMMEEFYEKDSNRSLVKCKEPLWKEFRQGIM